MDEEYGSFGMVGNSDPMKRLYETIARVAPADVIVLITGERGTGKELVARAIHRHSKRSGKKFVVVDSPAVPSEIFESELFGHERGAFTGARERRIGKMEYANNGTVFFDGIEHLSLTLQPKLLRIVEQQEFSRMGGNEIIRTDVRLISATAYDLKRLSEEGRFRPELYDRLHGIHVHVPLLKDRMGDVPLLAVYFLGERRIEPEALEFMCQYSWPGNVRELQLAVQRLATMSDGTITLDDVKRYGEICDDIQCQIKITPDYLDRLYDALKDGKSYADGNDRSGSNLYRLRETREIYTIRNGGTIYTISEWKNVMRSNPDIFPDYPHWSWEQALHYAICRKGTAKKQRLVEAFQAVQDNEVDIYIDELMESTSAATL